MNSQRGGEVGSSWSLINFLEKEWVLREAAGICLGQSLGWMSELPAE
jgi:hypothetical protein